MPRYILDMAEDASEDLSYYRAFERKTITDEIAMQLVTSRMSKPIAVGTCATIRLRAGN